NFKLFSISGHKYTDVNGNDATAGIGADDTGLSGIKIDLFDSGNLVTPLPAEKTAAVGRRGHTVRRLLPARHTAVLQPELPGGYSQTFGIAGYRVPTTTLFPYTTLFRSNFKLFSISGHKYTDVNGNDATAGIGADDTGLSGIKIDLFDSGNLVTP